MRVALGNGVMWENEQAWNCSWTQFCLLQETSLAEGSFGPCHHG